jgi:hypothetical protein
MSLYASQAGIRREVFLHARSPASIVGQSDPRAQIPAMPVTTTRRINTDLH